jgi:pyruvate, orthophosphate dikinase
VADSVLNLGINDEIMEHLAVTLPGANRRFALDTYRRFLRVFGTSILGVSAKEYDAVEARVAEKEGKSSLLTVSEAGMEEVVTGFKSVISIPHDPMEQLWLAISNMYFSLQSAE